MKIKPLRIVIKLIVMVIISLIVFFEMELGERFQYINKLDYQVALNNDGSMNVTETWDINVNNTNTLFKNFELSNSKYGDITDVEVVDLDTGKKLTQINEEMYYVPLDSYYALPIKDNKFEIAWGVGMNSKYGNRKYQISYKVNDVITQYKDFQELYWQFFGKGENAVPVAKITGKVTLPQEVSNIDKLRVWGHGQLNGNIEKIDKQTVYFEMDNLYPREMFEIRLAIEDNMFNNTNVNKIRNYNYLNSAISEETQWAKEANSQSNFYKIFWLVILSIYLIVIVVTIVRIKKELKLNKQKGDGIKHNKLEYYRDIPREENSTPTEAAYLYYFNKKRLETGKVQSEAVASIILDLALKRIISLTIENDGKVKVKIESEPTDLKKDELAIYELLKDVSSDREEFTLEELKTYAKTKYTKYSEFINRTVNSARNSLYDLNLIDKEQEKQYSKSEEVNTKIAIVKNVYIWLIITYMLSLIQIFKTAFIKEMGIDAQSSILKFLIFSFPVICLLLYLWKLQKENYKKIAVLTQAGSDEKEQWKGLVKYIKNYSLLNEKKVPDLVIWEKYLVYATAFGIADEVIKQMKANYPEVFIKEKWEDDRMKKQYPVIYFSMNPYYYETNTLSPITRISANTKSAYNTSLAKMTPHSSSSGSGGGGGFSSGGGGRRWPEAGMGGR